MKIPTNKPEILREFPAAQNPFLRFQFGFTESRPARVPVWASPGSKSIVGFKNGETVSLFRLCGYGSTIERAAKMAGVTLEKEKAA